MIFQSDKYCDIVVRQRVEDGSESLYRVRIRDTGDTHLDITCKDLSHALELWTAIERSPGVMIVVNVNDYIVKEETFPCPHCKESYPWPNEGQRDYHMAIKHPKEFGARVRELIAEADEFADCRHRPIKDSKPSEFDLERME